MLGNLPGVPLFLQTGNGAHQFQEPQPATARTGFRRRFLDQFHERWRQVLNEFPLGQKIPDLYVQFIGGGIPQKSPARSLQIYGNRSAVDLHGRFVRGIKF